MHNKGLGPNTNSILAVLLIIAFTVIGIWLGTSEPTTSETFVGTLRRFGTDDKARIILALILIDVVTGVICALKLRIFDIQRLASFYGSSVVPYVFGYLLVWVVLLLGLDSVLTASTQLWLTSLAFAMIATALTGSIIDNVQRMTTALSFTNSNDQVASPPENTKG